MAQVILISGSTFSSVTGTESTLANLNIPGRFQLVVDLSNMAAGDAVELRSYQAVLGSGTARVSSYMGYYGVQPTDFSVVFSPVIDHDLSDPTSLKFTLKHTYGASRNFPWKVVEVDQTPPNFQSLGISSLGHISNVDLVGQVTGSVMSTVSGTAASVDFSQVWSFTGTRSLNGIQNWNLSGTVGALATNLDKVSYFLGTPQRYDRIGNTTGSTEGSLTIVVTGTTPSIDYSQVWSFTGTRSLNGIQNWNLSGTVGAVATVLDKVNYQLLSPQYVNISGTVAYVVYVGTVTGSVANVLTPVVASAVQGGFVTVSGAVTVGTNNDKTGYSLSNPQVWNLIGNITGSIVGNVSGTVGAVATILDKVNYQLALNQIANISGTMTSVFNVLNPVLADVRSLVGVSGTVVASAVQGGYVTVSGVVVADVRSLVGVSGTVIASVVQGGFVTVSGSVTVGTNLDKTGYFLGTPQVYDRIGNTTGTTVGNISGTVGALATNLDKVNYQLLNNQVVNFSGTITNVFNVLNPVVADVRSLVGISGTVVVGTNQDKSGYSLSDPQRFTLIGNISGSMVGNLYGYVGQVTGSVMSVVSGASVSFDPSLVWAFTGTRSLNGNQFWNLYGFVGQVTGSVLSVISGTAASFDPSLVWSFTGSRALNGNQFWNLYGFVGQVTGSAMSLVSGSAAAIDYSQIWNFTGTKTIDFLRGLVGVSGTVIASVVQGGYVTVSGTVNANVGSVNVSGLNPAYLDTYVSSRLASGVVTVGVNQDKSGYSLSSPQHFDLIGNISGTITNVFNVISGTQSQIDPASIWGYTGSRTVDAVKGGFVTVSGSVVASAVQGGYVTASGVTVNIDYSQIWNYSGSKVVDAVKGGYVNASGIVINATGVSIDPASIWNYFSRTLTSQVFNLPPVAQGNNLNIMRGDTFTWSPTNLGSLANLSKLFFTIKRIYADLDSESELQVEKSAGLVYINRAPAANPAHGSIVVNDVNLGNITIVVDAVETAKLDLLMDVFYDVQFVNTSGTVTTLVAGPVTIQGDSTRSTGP